MTTELERAERRPPGEIDHEPTEHRGFDYCRVCGYPGVGRWVFAWDDGHVTRRCPVCLSEQL